MKPLPAALASIRKAYELGAHVEQITVYGLTEESARYLVAWLDQNGIEHKGTASSQGRRCVPLCFPKPKDVDNDI
jgi:hypothetical protein